jgi:hypothetical protein
MYDLAQNNHWQDEAFLVSGPTPNGVKGQSFVVAHDVPYLLETDNFAPSSV